MIKKLLKYVVFTAVLIILLSVGVKASAADVRSGGKSEVDVTNINDGYIKVRMSSSTEKKIKVKTSYEKEDRTKNEYTYDLNGNCDWETYSLQSGDGIYTIQVLVNVDGTRYTVIQTVTVNVKYSREYAPFLIPIQNVNYKENDAAVKKAAELCEGSKTDLEKVVSVYEFIVETIKYDYDKAGRFASGEIKTYLPSIDVTLETGMGVCFDFSSLFAAMLRSQGIPIKLAMGYVEASPKPVYHAWNEVYIKDIGWIIIRSQIYFDGENWQRMDSTLASSNASGLNTAYMSDDGNYFKDKEY